MKWWKNKKLWTFVIGQVITIATFVVGQYVPQEHKELCMILVGTFEGATLLLVGLFFVESNVKNFMTARIEALELEISANAAHDRDRIEALLRKR